MNSLNRWNDSEIVISWINQIGLLLAIANPNSKRTFSFKLVISQQNESPNSISFSIVEIKKFPPIDKLFQLVIWTLWPPLLISLIAVSINSSHDVSEPYAKNALVCFP